MAPRGACIGLLLANVVQVSAADPTLVTTKQQLRDILSDPTPWLLHFNDDDPTAFLPANEEDTREQAWFTKLAHVWPRDIAEGKLAWAGHLHGREVKFASVGKIDLADADSAVKDSAVNDSVVDALAARKKGFRFLIGGVDQGPPVNRMASRREMLQAVQSMAAMLDGIKRAEKRDEL